MSEDKDSKRKKLLLAKIAQFRLFDDDFMSKVFEDDIEATEFLLRIILQRDDLEVTESKGQVSIKNLLGRSVRLDIKAKDKLANFTILKFREPTAELVKSVQDITVRFWMQILFCPVKILINCPKHTLFS